MRHGIVHLLIFICFAACFYGCRSSRSVTRKTVTEATGEEKQTTTDGVIELARRDSSNEEHVLDVYREDSTHIRINYDSLGRIKEIDFSNRKTEKRTGKNQSSSFQDHKETTSQAETVVTRKSDVKQQSQEKEKVTNGCSLWTFLKFMFFFLSFAWSMITGAGLIVLSAGYGKNKPLCSGRTDETDYHSGGTFSIKFRKWNRQTRDGGDMVILTAARLRKKATDESIENSSYKLFLTDTTTGRPLNCWECLVMEFNGKRITI